MTSAAAGSKPVQLTDARHVLGPTRGGGVGTIVSRPVTGLVLGVAAAVIVVAVITLFVDSDMSLWWWPAALVIGAIGGGVIGALLGEEAAGESPDEGYDDPESKA
jgi:hypothetical protein